MKFIGIAGKILLALGILDQVRIEVKFFPSFFF